ncbi:hypothetical protein PIB30_101106, partial [Stylosanthes scabra]|nr:hypothetical protein [Stylosanthes scabra]
LGDGIKWESVVVIGGLGFVGIVKDRVGVNWLGAGWGTLKREKVQKEAWKARKEQNRATVHLNRGLMPRHYYPRLGVAELASPLSLIKHPTPRRDARRLGVDGEARKLALHQSLNAYAWTQNA